MSFWTAVVVLFAIAAVTWLKAQRYRTLGERREDGTYGPSGREKELERQVEEMRKRLAVLERIATDDQRGRDLAHEIEKLRD
ncbi:hypothetical protein WSK_4315 [Novosphingobium sp. Rr 2-17]|uniref:hypothetical protein n=1 Tax=Novosphingobium sp. Rr 2-17 TaxID=555793 RepID=UPI0002697F16|nr:hypothetical protein [Novosphingobium sp. Rr 2-17]EIZ77131.1 hypothetical protein WSK_4315 [Novosphingobium sp. Rr 2-17]